MCAACVAAFGRKRVRDAREAGTASSGFRDHAKRWCAALVETRMVLLGLSEEVDRLVHGESK